MQNFELIPFLTADELARAVTGAWLDEVVTAQRTGKAHRVALSGGRITQKFFAAVVGLSKSREVSLMNVHFFWADERCVPPTDADSNFKPANELLFAPLKISPANIHRIPGELPPAQAAQSASAELARTIPGAGAIPVLDLILLGMGEDGHVASLFPCATEEIIRCEKPFLSISGSPKPPPNRVTLSYAAIAAARQVWVLASGAGKADALAESLSPTGKTPLARVLQNRAATKVFTDIA